eukprot:scaffold45052_cov32-Tisochrysis_lutea.AAC.1
MVDPKFIKKFSKFSPVPSRRGLAFDTGPSTIDSNRAKLGTIDNRWNGGILWSRRSPDSHIWDGGWHGDLIVHRTRDAVSGDDVRFQVGMAWPGEIINLRNSAIVFLVEEDAAARSFGSRNLRCARSPENFSESQAASSLEPLSGAEA